MSLAVSEDLRFNLSRAAVLLVDESPIGMSILAQIVSGLGVKTMYRCESEQAARDIADTVHVDFAIVDALGPSCGGYSFVQWLRRNAPDKKRYIPVLLTASHTPAWHVEIVERSGGDALIKKPIAPMTLLQRILWAARPDRKFVIGDDYVGPERRHRAAPAPAQDRRSDRSEAFI